LITAPDMEIAVESRKKKPMSIFKSLRK